MSRSALALLAALLATPGCVWTRIGDLNMVSTRNIDMKADYELLASNRSVRVANQQDALEAAIDKVVTEIPGGEYAMNARLFVKANGRRVRIDADVWGLPVATRTSFAGLTIGDRVSWKSTLGAWMEGTVIGLDADGVLIEVAEGATGLMGKVNSLAGVQRVRKDATDVTRLAPDTEATPPTSP